MQSNKSVGVLGIGSCLPDKVLTNADLEKIVETNDEWIVKRTGISERRILDEQTPAYTLGIEAGKRALADAGVDASEVGLVIATTGTPDYLSPQSACLIAHGVGASKAAAFDLNAQCSGFMYGMSVAQQMINGGVYKYVLIVAVEGLSKIVDWQDRNTCVLFGDGAGAMLLGEVEAGYGILGTTLGSDGGSGNVINIPGTFRDEAETALRVSNPRSIRMDGNPVFEFAVKIMGTAAEEALGKAGVASEDVALFVPHQANIRIIKSAAKRIGVSMDRVVVSLDKTGNISSASIPCALDIAYREGRVKHGDHLVLVGFGGGLTWGSVVLKWAK